MCFLDKGVKPNIFLLNTKQMSKVEGKNRVVLKKSPVSFTKYRCGLRSSNFLKASRQKVYIIKTVYILNLNIG